ncbi:MAG: hypothetical protein H6555_05455 [Lewinellaceae bacterium]|nr:hypothetical protein [Lewinellaceae bacterium]
MQRTISWVLFGGGILLELGMQTMWMNALGPHWSPVAWFIGASLTVAGAIGLGPGQFSLQETPWKSSLTRQRNLFLVWGIVGTLSCLALPFLWETFQAHPVDPQNSDIVPSLQLYVRRLLSGQPIYAPMEFPGWTVLPTYFPLMWLPYVFSELLALDYRWTAYVLFVAVIALYTWRLHRQQLPLGELAVKAALPLLFLFTFLVWKRDVFGYAVELTPVAFYLFLAFSIGNRRPWLMGLGILVCLLSRYSFTFWLPVYGLILWADRGFKPALQTALWAVLGVLLLYVFPFLLRDPEIILNGLRYYGDTAIGQWQTQTWQAAGEKPAHLFRGLSFSAWFYDYASGEIAQRLALQRQVHLFACALTALGILGGYFWRRPKIQSVRFFLLVSLKAYLIVFYGFFYVPFSYLYMVPVFLSIALIYETSGKPPGASTVTSSIND